MSSPLNIFLIDDNEQVCEDIKISLENSFVNRVKVHPQKLNQSGNDLTYLRHVLAELGKNANEKKFEKIVKYYTETVPCDLFIIDISLLHQSSNDEIGLQLANYIESNHPDKKIFIITNSRANVLSKVSSAENVTLIKKLDHGYKLPKRVVELVQEKFNIAASKNNNPKRGGRATESEKSLNTKVLQVRDTVERIVDHVISACFYILLLLTIVASSFTIVVDNFVNVKNSLHKTVEIINGDSLTHQVHGEKNVHVSAVSENPHEGKEEEGDELKTAEHIFINLLPVFIILGFFGYYKDRLRYVLGYPLYGANQNDSLESLSTLNNAKFLFTSAIISFLVIRMISMLVAPEVLDLSTFISSGALLLVLIGYFIFQHKRH